MVFHALKYQFSHLRLSSVGQSIPRERGKERWRFHLGGVTCKLHVSCVCAATEHGSMIHIASERAKRKHDYPLRVIDIWRLEYYIHTYIHICTHTRAD